MKLHIGCGNKYLPGWKHVDVINAPHIDYLTNAQDLSMIENESIEEIYACHVLEHFGRKEINAVLEEWNRVMIKGGVLRIAVPDFEKIALVYQKNKDLNELMGLLYGGQNYDYNYHYQCFDFDRIKVLLGEANFFEVKRYKWEEFLPEGFDDFSRAYLPHMDFANGVLMSLNIIARKS